MTSLDQHRDRNADGTWQNAIRDRISQSGVEFIYYQAVTLTGRIVAKVVPAKQLSRNIEQGINLHRGAIADLQTDRHGTLIGGGVSAPEFTAMPDLDTFDVLPWDPSVARMLCTLYEPAHMPVVGGQPLASDCRGLLHRAHEAFQASTGLELRTGCEPEMSWSGPGLEVSHRPDASPAYAQENLERMRPIYQRLIRYATELNFDMIEGDYEDPGQLELNWMFDRAERTADRLTTYRMICRQVAREFGVTASFMPKPTTGAMGNGCHHNLSLWRGNVNMLAEPGRRDLHLTDIGRHALGGLLTHASAAMAVMGPTVNSYKRFWDSGQFAPSIINWGMDNKTCTVRLSAIGRLEFKLPDAAVNPYLSHTLLLASVADGLANEVDPGEPQIGSSYEEETENFASLPLTLGESITAFCDNKVLRNALPSELVTTYIALKRDEWARYCGAVTDWERDLYSEVLS
ncbi:glutamine synthetase [Gordonia sp. TBRC 11910]|uniref:glutamine synthetase n=1 Tax=Gordonia asplenii TaxID=2725283 RepID=A0A848KPB6_9ACTN|nr:glutamine synthetase [Gordonia asplenii]NMO00884.1 glutamine synthetase [Gordonia asplenii]